MIDKNKNKNKPMSNSEGGKRERRERRERWKTYSKQVLEWRQNGLRVRKCDRAQRIKIEDYRLYKLKKEKISSLDLDQGGNHTQNYFPIQYVKSHQNKKLIHENELYIMNDLFFHSNPWQISPVSGTSTEKERDVQSNERVYLSQLIPHGSIGSSQSQQDEL